MQIFNMKPGTIIFALLLSFSFFSVCYADDFRDGVRAYQRQDFKLAHDKWLPLANEGHVLAQTLLGSLYAYGEGVERDDRQAAHWFRLAAEGGSAQAQYNLGILYEKGWGVEQSNDKARKWYRQATNNGRKDAASRLALLTELGNDNTPATDQAENTEPVADAPLMPFIDIQEDVARHQALDNPAWLKQQPAHFYTLQLAASVEKRLLQEQAANLPLEQQYAIVDSSRNGTRWYALVYGSYTSIEDARQAHSRLPPNLSAWQPWVRPFGDIKTWRVHAGLEKK